jgi:hypothetical protein
MTKLINGGTIFFVLNGLYNGVSGEFATPPGGGNEPPYEDGWYFLPDGSEFPLGPYVSRDEAVRDTAQVELLGHTFTRMTEIDVNHTSDSLDERCWHADLGRDGDLYWCPDSGFIMHISCLDGTETIWKRITGV